MNSLAFLRTLLALALLWAGALNAAGPRFVRLEYADWGYPAWLRHAVALAEVAAAALLLSAAYRFGAALGLLVLAGVYVTLIRHRQWMRLEYPLVLGAIAVFLCIG